MSSSERDQYRGIAEQIVKRAEQDDQFAKQAKANPMATLTAAGIPEKAAKQMLEGSENEEVSGYAMSHCTDTTCYTSTCPATCYVTIIFW